MAGGEFRLGTVATYMSTYISILTISHNPYRKHIHVNHPASTNLGFGVLPPNLDLRYVELRSSRALPSTGTPSNLRHTSGGHEMKVPAVRRLSVVSTSLLLLFLLS